MLAIHNKTPVQIFNQVLFHCQLLSLNRSTLVKRDENMPKPFSILAKFRNFLDDAIAGSVHLEIGVQIISRQLAMTTSTGPAHLFTLRISSSCCPRRCIEVIAYIVVPPWLSPPAKPVSFSGAQAPVSRHDKACRDCLVAKLLYSETP
jgi:hypothetical protein